LPNHGGLEINLIDSTAINAVLNRYLESHARTGTNTLALHLGALLGFAVEKGWMEKWPSIPMIPVQKRARPIVTEETLDQFLAVVDAQGCLPASFLVRAQVYMGRRNHEARMMKWSGLRMEQRSFIPDKTKNGDAPLMPIPDVMLPWFDKMAQETGTFGLICPGKTGEPRAHDFTIRYIRRALKAVGLLEDITDHRLRASFANILNKKGVPLPTIQKLMRHSKIETTRIYIETHEDEMRSAINLMR
jgi:integrase